VTARTPAAPRQRTSCGDGIPIGRIAGLLLLAFNLLPAFPLDGGRLLRAALWGAMGDELGATRAAVGVSRRLAYTLIAVGLLGALRGIPGGLWLAFVGWFVITAAGAERQAVYDRRGLT